MRDRPIRCAFVRGAALVCLGGLLSWAQQATAQTAGATELQREQREQIEQWRRQIQRPAELPEAMAPEVWLPPLAGEQPCVVLRSVVVSVADEPASGLSSAVPWRLIAPPADYLGVCLGVASLQRLSTNMQARLHALGYVTSSLTLAEQNLGSGELRFSLHWGRIGQVRVESTDDQPLTVAGPASNALAVRPGQVLNLRDIEHTLENLARLPSQNARFVIEPGTTPGISDLRILVSGASGWRGSVGFDSADLKARSSWEAQTQLVVDAPLDWSDQLLVSAAGTPERSGEQRQQRHSVYVQWSVPWRRHLITLSASTARNSRSIAGGVGRFVERGHEDQTTLRWQWTPWRGADWRTQLWSSWSQRHGRSFIDDVELLSRRRRAGDLGLGLSHWQRLPCGEASVELEGIHTRRLVRVAEFQDVRAPMPRQWRMQWDLHCSVHGAGSGDWTDDRVIPWTWGLTAWTQAIERPFDGTDLLALGSRYTVRGHAPDQALLGRRISVVRLSATAPGRTTDSGLAWQPWLAWDVGRVDRPSDAEAHADVAPRGRQAAVLGLRWQFMGAAGELAGARPVGSSPTRRHWQWQAQASWRF